MLGGLSCTHLANVHVSLVCARDCTSPWSALSTALSGTQGLVSLAQCTDNVKEMLYKNISQDETNKNSTGYTETIHFYFFLIVL